MSAHTQTLVAPNGKQIELPTGLFINNEFISGHAEEIATINPTNEEIICSVQSASPEDIDTAVSAARTAFNKPEWRQLDPTERGRMLNRLADLIEAEKEVLATLEAWDNGKSYSSALGEDIEEVLGVLRYYAGWADKIHGQTASDIKGYKFGFTIREPTGICAQIIPWNYPLGMLSWKLGPAIACGNAVILKPAEQTPLSALYLASLVLRAGFPPGIVNIVNGLGPVAGAALASHLDIDKVAFTGSTSTARKIMQLASSNLKSITLETGGKSPLLIFPDANLDQATKWAMYGFVSNQGQICTATTRILVHRSIVDDVIARLKSHIESICVIGDPFDEETFHGPQVTRAQYERILGFIERAQSQGAQLVCGGKPAYGGERPEKKGYFIEPTIFSAVSPDMEIFQEEVFGPVACLTVFDTDEEALKLANGTKYGLAASVFTQDVLRAHTIATRLESGQVWINSAIDNDVRMPFGGVKQSGIGRELGEKGLEAYSQTKAVYLNMGMSL